MASQTIGSRFNPHTHPTLGIIARYTTGLMKTPLTLDGLDAKQMRENLEDPEFIEAVAKLGFTAEAVEKEKKDEKGGVMHVICRALPKPAPEKPKGW